MTLMQRLWMRWRKIDPETRRHIKHSVTWITAYLICIPSMLYIMLIQIYDLQTKAAIKMRVPQEVSSDTFNKWLEKQQKQGNFLDEKKQ